MKNILYIIERQKATTGKPAQFTYQMTIMVISFLQLFIYITYIWSTYLFTNGLTVSVMFCVSK